MATHPSIQSKTGSAFWRRYLPLLSWLPAYRRDTFTSDLLAGLIVAIMLIPQGMAYALLAGLPPQMGLYASIVPLILYGLLGTSRTLAVGPVAMVSLLVASSLGPLAEVGSAGYIQLALTLALLAGLMQAAMGLLRVGFMANFLSHPVLSGFTSAAALVIGFSQLKYILGIQMPRLESFYAQMAYTAAHLSETNSTTLLIGGASAGLLLYFKRGLAAQLRRWGVPAGWAIPLTKSAPLVVVACGTLLVWWFNLYTTAGVSIVGGVPLGLPPLTLPTLDLAVWRQLLPAAVVISLVGYMESISVAKSLASKRREKLNPNQELIALGIADIGAALTGGYPVTGGISRSVVNDSAGAQTGMASIITALLIALTVLFLTPIFYFLPHAVLAAIIIVAVVGMINVATFVEMWRYNKADGLSLLITFAAVLIAGVETGILYGVAAALLLYIWRTSQPHVAVVGRLGDSEIYRNVLRHPVQTWPHVLTIRIDESLYFANAKYLEDTVLSQVADHPDVAHVVLICTAVNFIDASALETLETLHAELGAAHVAFHLSAVKGPVMDRLAHSGFIDHIGRDHIHLSTHAAMQTLGCVSPKQS